MSRSDQYFGLNERANKILQRDSMWKVGVRTTVYKDGRPDLTEDAYEPTTQERVIGHFSGMFDAEYNLREFTLKDGRVFTEFLQAEPWSSGPMMFTALKDKDGKVVKDSLWTNNDPETENQIPPHCDTHDLYEDECPQCRTACGLEESTR